jgi:peptidoglycan/LPS O-acetylase OafA/YrhL
MDTRVKPAYDTYVASAMPEISPMGSESSKALEISSGGKRNDEIESLRALAVLFVLLEHINYLLYWRHDDLGAGYINPYGGVDLFFCISGFVITAAFGAEISQAVAEPARYWRTVAAFYIRRAYRILPLSWAAFFGVLAFLLIVHGWSEDLITRSLGDFLAIAFNVQNIHYGSCAVVDTHYCGAFGIYWSLSLEEQFYMVFPLVFLLPRKWMIGVLIGAVILFALLPRTTMVWMTRVDAIALGVLLGLSRETEAYKALAPTILSRWPFRWTALTVLMVGLAVIPTGIVPFYPTMVSVISLLLVFVASHDREFLFAKGPLRSGLVWVGQRSFAIYLIHDAVFRAVQGACRIVFPPTQPDGWTVVVLIAAASVVLAILADLSFRWLETPLRKRGKQVASDFLRQGAEPVPHISRAAE